MDRALARYRIIFRASAAAVIAGILLTSVGVLALVFTPDRWLFAGGLLLISMGGLNAYRSVVSTMHIIDAEVPRT
jgi:hypothetical protein